VKRQEAERRGRRAEAITAWYLRLKGWRILARRARTPVGEIDIVARRGRMTAFVEVKARDTQRGLDLAVDRQRLKRVAAAATYLESRYAAPGGDIRIDVILIAPRTWPRHLENVWDG
jgi:putative endonuclease